MPGQITIRPEQPDIDAINSRYGGWHMTPSNIMFSNGELDPWRTLGVQSDLKINPSAHVRKSTMTVPPCNKPPSGDEVFGQIYAGQVSVTFSLERGSPYGGLLKAFCGYSRNLSLLLSKLDSYAPLAVLADIFQQVHAQDLIKRTYSNRTGPAPFDLGFELFSKALDEWLPCFEKKHEHEHEHEPHLQQPLGLPQLKD